MPPRTPADIGRDIAAAEQRIRDLKAELGSVPPANLVLASKNARAGTLDVEPTRGSSPYWRDCFELHDRGEGGFRMIEAAPLRDWLNYYYPKEA